MTRPSHRSVSISSTVEMPLLGFGTWRLAEGTEVEQAVGWALEAGYRHIDTAAFYGNERGIGNAVRASGLDRADVFIATKVWNSDQGFDRTLAAFEASLGRLQMGHVDLYLVHWPDEILMESTWRAMESILRSGRAKAIGVCNFMAGHLDQLVSLAEVPPAVNQVEFHPHLQIPDTVEACRTYGIQIEAWSPLKKGAVVDMPEVLAIAARLDRSPAQVTLRWLIQKGIAAIPKSSRKERIVENFSVFDFELATDDLAVLDGLARADRIGPVPGSFF